MCQDVELRHFNDWCGKKNRTCVFTGLYNDTALGNYSSPLSTPMIEVLDNMDKAGQGATWGMVSLAQGYLLLSIVFASTMVYIIEREFLRAAMWLLLAAGLSITGAIHSFVITDAGIFQNYGLPPAGSHTLSRPWYYSNHDFVVQYASMYLGGAVILAMLYVKEQDRSLKAWWRLLRHHCRDAASACLRAATCACLRRATDSQSGSGDGVPHNDGRMDHGEP